MLSGASRGGAVLHSSQQKHIEELVNRNKALEQTNRTLEQTIKRLKEQLEARAVAEKSKTAELNKDWQQACDILKTMHRLNELRFLDELEQERIHVLNEQDAIRKQKIVRLQKEYALIQYQARESELELRVQATEDERDELQESLSLTKIHTERFIAKYVQENKSQKVRISELEDNLAKSREASAQHQTSTETNASKLERTRLQLDGATSKIEEFERKTAHLERKNADLQRQIEKWQKLETREGAEAESLRKSRIELEVKATALQEQLDKKNEELGKSKQNVKKFKETLGEWQEANKQLADDLEEAKTSLDQALEENAGLKRQLRDSLKRPAPPPQSEPEEPVAGPSKPRSKRGKPPPPEIVEDSEVEEVSQPTKPKSRRKADSDVEEVKKPSSRKKRATNDDTDIEELPAKGRSKGKRGKAEDTDVEEEAPKRRRKGKAKAASDSETEAVDNEGAPPKRQHSSQSIRAPSLQPTVVDDSASETTEQKKKKRKINVFPSAGPSTFNFGQLGGSGLDIPTALSPVKESEVPKRSISSKVSDIISGFTRRN